MQTAESRAHAAGTYSTTLRESAPITTQAKCCKDTENSSANDIYFEERTIEWESRHRLTVTNQDRANTHNIAKESKHKALRMNEYECDRMTRLNA